MVPECKTFAEHLNYLHKVSRLQLHFLWRWAKAHPEEEFRRALRTRVDLYRKTDINPGYANCKRRNFDDPRWLLLEARLEEAFQSNRENADRFEAEAFEAARPSIDARAPRDFAEPPEAVAFHYRCGSLDFDPPSPQKPDTKRGGIPLPVFLHIANAVQPRSLLDDREHLLGCFREFVRQSRFGYGAEKVETVTWLNSYPRWLEWFPASWRAHCGPELREVDSGFGFWGQFLTARGTFNEKYGRHLRATGELPYWPRHAWCGLDELEKHLGL